MKSLIYSSLAISALSQDNNNNNNTNNNNNNNDISIPTPPYNPDEVANLYRNLGASDSVIANNFKIKVSQHSQTGLTRSTQSVSYGCWCFFDEMPIMTGQTKPFKPKGKPVDKLDGYCKSLNEAYECVASDYPTDKNGDLCDPRNTPKILTENWWIDINYNMNTPITDAELNQACLTLNNNIDSCEVYICMIEASFLIKFWDKNEDFLNDNAYAQFGYAWDTDQFSKFVCDF